MKERKKKLDFSGNQHQPLSPIQSEHDSQQKNLITTHNTAHYQVSQNQPQYYAEGITSSSHQIEPPPTLNQAIKHTEHNRGGTITRGMRTGVGDIVQVEGGHIVRSTGRKDRHSKVYTSKGPRDRRVRLSAHTAIEFYDVQDRLGYDRPSKAVDWLIKKAKTSIDRLAELPPWHPPTHEEEKQNDAAGSSGIIAIAQQQQQHEQQSESCGYNFQLQRQLGPSVQPMLTLTPSIFKPTTPQKILAYPSIASKTTLASFIGNHNRQVHIKHLLQMNTKSEPFLLAQPQVALRTIIKEV